MGCCYLLEFSILRPLGILIKLSTSFAIQLAIIDQLYVVFQSPIASFESTCSSAEQLPGLKRRNASAFFSESNGLPRELGKHACVISKSQNEFHLSLRIVYCEFFSSNCEWC